MRTVEQVKEYVWQRIREHQAREHANWEGAMFPGVVQSFFMAQEFGGERGGYTGPCRCVLGVVSDSPHDRSTEVLEITWLGVGLLEAGFEGWTVNGMDAKNEFYLLGQEIAAQLVDEAREKMGAE